MRRNPTKTLTLLAFVALSCSSNRHILKTSERTYRLSCETSLAKCLELAESPCHSGFDVKSGKDVRERSGVDAVGTGATETRVSEAVVVCRSDAFFGSDDDDADEPSGPRLLRKQVCVAGSSQACVGPGGCAGGQSCLADGTAYDRCDCGEFHTAPGTTAPPPASAVPSSTAPPANTAVPSATAPNASTSKPPGPVPSSAATAAPSASSPNPQSAPVPPSSRAPDPTKAP
jgi:hypothetical protein